MCTLVACQAEKQERNRNAFQELTLQPLAFLVGRVGLPLLGHESLVARSNFEQRSCCCDVKNSCVPLSDNKETIRNRPPNHVKRCSATPGHKGLFGRIRGRVINLQFEHECWV